MELARVSVLTFDVTSTVYASARGKRLASVMTKSNKKIDGKNLIFLIFVSVSIFANGV